MEALQCLFAFASRVAPLSIVQQDAMEEVQDRQLRDASGI